MDVFTKSIKNIVRSVIILLDFKSIFDTSARFASAVRRINDRLKMIAQRLSKNSYEYQKYSTELDLMIPDAYKRYNKDGVLQVAKPIALYKENDNSVFNEIHTLDKGMETYGKIKERYEKSYEELLERYKTENEQGFGSEVTRENFTLDDFVKVNESLDSTLPILYAHMESEDVKSAIDILHIKGRKKTYAELVNVIDVGDAYV